MIFFSILRRANIVPDEKVVKEVVAELEKKLDVYEVILEKQKYIGGNVSWTKDLSHHGRLSEQIYLFFQEFTLADLFHLSYGSMIEDEGGISVLSKESRPHVAKYVSFPLDRDPTLSTSLLIQVVEGDFQ